MNLSGLLVEGGNSDFIETIGNLQKEVQVILILLFSQGQWKIN